MTILQYLTSPQYGCCKTNELIELSKADKQALDTLKQYARDEMAARGIEVTEK